MKKILMAFVCLFALVACGGDDDGEYGYETYLITKDELKQVEKWNYDGGSANTYLMFWRSMDGSVTYFKNGQIGTYTSIDYRIAPCDSKKQYLMLGKNGEVKAELEAMKVKEKGIETRYIFIHGSGKYNIDGKYKQYY